MKQRPAQKRIGIIERYLEFLPATSQTPIISLNEGNTPLILSEALPKFRHSQSDLLQVRGLKPDRFF